jgi:hypothetical protein
MEDNLSRDAEREKQFISHVGSLINSKSDSKIEIRSYTFLKDLSCNGIEIEGVLSESGKLMKLTVDYATIQVYIYNDGNYTISDFFKALVRRENIKKALKQIRVYKYIAYALAIIAAYNLVNANLIETVICSSIGSSMYFYTENRRRFFISMIKSGADI